MKHHLGLIKEPSYETRVAFLPEEVKKLIDKYEVTISAEKEYGIQLGIPDADYTAVGASMSSKSDILQNANLILSINDAIEEQESIPPETSFIGIYNPLFFPERLQKYKNQHALVYSLDRLPRTTLAQAMDVRSSLDALSGYKAVLKATDYYSKVFPMITTATKTLKPARVLVLGAGVAGLQAIATAKRLGAIVHAFDVRKAAGEEVRSLGAKFIEIEGNKEETNAGGYAVEQADDYKKRQQDRINEQLLATDLVICTANIPGKKAPILVDEDGVKNMPSGAVIIDLAAEQGGNCSLTKNNEIVNYNSVKILGDSHLSRELPDAASQLLSGNFFNFIKHMIEKGADNDLITASQVINQENT
ncbi:MAG: NAD(P) transhydrogenase subunit alpha [Mesonia sp.]|uniref:NAD(P) transhydrogenase subunit alpha n=1 Tax=Mesonia sp. TaxID=1960830 RepID=UPI003F948271